MLINLLSSSEVQEGDFIKKIKNNVEQTYNVLGTLLERNLIGILQTLTESCVYIPIT